jgi:flagellar biosynthesis component FlhA
MKNWIERLILQEIDPAKVYPYGERKSDLGGRAALMVGANIVPLIDPEKNGPILKRLKHVRSQILFEEGLNIKGIRVMDNLKLDPNSYSIVVDKEILLDGEIRPEKSFFPFPKETLISEKIKGDKSVNPVSGLEGYWISEKEVEKVRKKGFDALSVVDYIVFHFLSTIRKYYLFNGRCEKYGFSEREKDIIKNIIEGYD